jgi:GT2 family glycosyltransferase
MAVHDLPDNNRDWMTAATLQSLLNTVDFGRHRIFISVNAGTDATWNAIWDFADNVKDALTVVDNGQNLGTAKAINKGWKTRQPGELCIKMDNDVVIHNAGWVDLMEEAVQRDPQIGIVGLKRIDLWERPDHPERRWRSELYFLPKAPGMEYWLPVERVEHVMGTCQGFNPALLDKIGYMYQPRLYGFDDSLAAFRCIAAGFYSCFLPHIRIDHIDPGGTAYQDWKRRVSGEDMAEYNRLKDGYLSGRISPYYDAEGNNVRLEELQKAEI